MVDAIDSALHRAPQGLDSVDVRPARHVLLGCVLDDLVGIAHPLDSPVAAELIGEENGIANIGNVAGDNGKQGARLDIGDNRGDGPALALDQAEHHRLARSPAPVLAALARPHVCFVNLDQTLQRADILSHEAANLLEHAPSGLVGDTQFPLKLLGGYARLSGGHEEHGMEPGAERGVGLVEDSACGGGDVGAAELAGVDLAAGDAVVRRHPLALLAGDALGPSCFLQEVKARIVGQELRVVKG